MLDSLNDVVEEGAACLEHEDQQFRLHAQCTLHLRMIVAKSAEDSSKQCFLKKLHETEVGNVRLCVWVRQEGGEVTVGRSSDR
jgi:hypothetical protein